MSSDKHEDYRNVWRRQVEVLYLRFTTHCETLEMVRRFAAKRGYDPARVEMARRKLIGENARSNGFEAREWAGFWLNKGKDPHWVVCELAALGNEEEFAQRLVSKLRACVPASIDRPDATSSPSLRSSARGRSASVKALAGELPTFRTESFTGLLNALQDLLWRVKHPQQARDLVPHVSHDARYVYAALKALAERGALECTTIKGTRIDRFRSATKRRGWFSEQQQALLSERTLAARHGIPRDLVRYRLNKGMSADAAASHPVNQSKSHPRSRKESATQAATRQEPRVADSGSKGSIRSSPTTVNKDDAGRSPSATTSSLWREESVKSSNWHEQHLKAVAARRKVESDTEPFQEEQETNVAESVLGSAKPNRELLAELGIRTSTPADTSPIQPSKKVAVVYMSRLGREDDM